MYSFAVAAIVLAVSAGSAISAPMPPGVPSEAAWVLEDRAGSLRPEAITAKDVLTSQAQSSGTIPGPPDGHGPPDGVGSPADLDPPVGCADLDTPGCDIASLALERRGRPEDAPFLGESTRSFIPKESGAVGPLSVVPEPSTWLLLAGGLTGLALWGRRVR